MIQVRCFVCSDELEEPGALYFTPPRQDSTTKKLHICLECDKDIRKTFTRVRRAVQVARPQRLGNIISLPPDVDTAARVVVAAWEKYRNNEDEEFDFDLLFAVGEAVAGLGMSESHDADHG